MTKSRAPNVSRAGIILAMDLLETITAVQEKERQIGYGGLASHERVVLDVAALEAAVNNGGLHQFFFNSASDRVAAIIDALKIIGARHAAEIVEEACRVFADGGPSADRNVRQDQLEQLDDDSFDSLDERFYSYPEPLGELLEMYWKKNPLPG